MTDPFAIALVVGTFLLAGTVKGVIGLGLPTLSLGLLAVAFDLPTAMALLIVPSLVTNLWQAAVGGNGRAILRRIWPFLSMAALTIWVGALALTRLDPSLLSGLLGVLLVVYAGFNLLGVRFSVAARHEAWAGPLFGAANGILTGMTGSFVVPGVLFLQAIGMHRDVLVQAMGMLFAVSTVALALALQQDDRFTMQMGMLSAIALVPAIIGMIIGRRIRGRLSEKTFRIFFFAGILLLGIHIIYGAARDLGWPS